MAEKLTEQQRQAVVDRGGRLLVSAAAGSGKTKVLVDRLMGYLTDPVRPADLDEFLIITYTKAAAAELRGKIATKITERIAAEPENRHLQRQLQRLHLTQISTVHAFCADILREYAYMLDIPADFRVADEDECLELQMRAMQLVLDEAYAQQDDPDFYAFVDTQGFGRDDRRVPEILLNVYHSAQCHLDPNAWLDNCTPALSVGELKDVGETVWGRYLMDTLKQYLRLQIDALERCANRALLADHMQEPAKLLASTVDQLRALCNCNTWDDICRNRQIDYGRLSFSKKCTDLVLIEQIKAVRDACKKGVTKRLGRFADDSEQLLRDYEQTMSATRGLVSMVKSFAQVYDRIKRGRRVLDFADLEHKTIALLHGRTGTGITRAAGEIALRFREVMVDEYQDSNAVQDAIFSILTQQRQNCFMVGDVKQSIYQFRLADPSIFIDKYNRFPFASEAEPGQGRKVILSKNFRSSGAVIKAVNDVFSTCMSPEVGGLVYGQEEMLYEGVPHVPLNDKEVELYGIDVKADTYTEEASFVAQRILQLLDGQHMIRDGEQLRPIVASDIAILLRSPNSVGWEYQYALMQNGIVCASGASVDLLQTEEIETLISLLQTIHNPLVDIPLVAVLSSRVFGFTADELAGIRSKHKGGSFYAALQASDNEKVRSFLNVLAQLRKYAQMNDVARLLMRIFSATRIDSIFAALPDGKMRSENLQQFCKIAASYASNSSYGLARFLEYIETLSHRGLAASGNAGTANAVTLMSIHKSKGLEFPVVFLCGLSRDFNQESLRSQVLCHKDLGLGLSCVDVNKRIQYPSVCKNAIAAKMLEESVSEEMRVLYVAMTRARDRLIMTYSAKNVQKEIDELALRMSLSDPLLLTSTATCPGTWILMTAITHRDDGWRFQVVSAPEAEGAAVFQAEQIDVISREQLAQLSDGLSFCYPHTDATQMPSKQTATQLKGRDKDQEAAQDAPETNDRHRYWRKPSFCEKTMTATDYGTAMHAVMQHISFEKCDSVNGVAEEIQRLQTEGYISAEQAQAVSQEQIATFFQTQIGQMIRISQHVLREFKFSILVDDPAIAGADSDDRILLQGVVDCAIVEDDGITVVDFKSDRISPEKLEQAVLHYTPQVASYAKALSRIYGLPVKSAKLYFFHIGQFADVI